MENSETVAGKTNANPSLPQYGAFVSYASADKPNAEAIVKTLEERGQKCWIAPRNVRQGREYGEEIIEGIRNSRCLVLVLSESANKSKYVSREVERAVNYGKPVFPIRVEEVLPARSLEFFVSATHWVDAWSGSMIDHATTLADEITDSRVGAEISEELQRRMRRRRLPRSIAGVTAFVAVIAAIVIGNAISNRINRQKAIASGAAPVIDQLSQDSGRDLSGLRAEQIKVGVRPETWSGPFQARLTIEAPSDLDGIVGQGNLEYRIGARPWKRIVTDVSDGTFFGMLDPKDLQAGPPVQLRFTTFGGDRIRTTEPFTYDLDVGKSVREQQLAATRTNAVWLSKQGEQWTVDLQFIRSIADIAHGIRIGASPDQLSKYVALPEVPKEEVSQETKIEYAVALSSFGVGLDLTEFDDSTTLYARVEYRDGKTGPTLRHDTKTANIRSARRSSRANQDWSDRQSKKALEGEWITDNMAHSGTVSFWPLKPAMDQIARIHLGSQADKLDRVIEVVDQSIGQDRIDRCFVRREDFDSQNIPIPSDTSVLHVKLEFTNSTMSEVHSFRLSESPHKMLRAPVQNAPKGAAVPAVYFMFSPRWNGLNLLPLLPPGTKRAVYALDEGGYENFMGSSWWNDHAFRLRNVGASKSIRIVYQMVDGSELGPVTYSLLGLETLVRASYKLEMQERRREAMVAYRFNFPYSAKTKRPESAEDRSKQEVRAFRLQTALRHIPEAHREIETPAVVVHALSQSGNWCAVKTVKFGGSAEKLDVTVTIQTDLGTAIQAGSTPALIPWHATLPADTSTVYARFVYFDDTESPAFDVPITNVSD